jgi:DNA-binding PadR family transcriptional regulator
MANMNPIFYSLCLHSCSIMDGWIPYPSTCISYTTKIDLPVVRKELRRLKKEGLVDSDLWVERGEERPILVRGYVVTEKGKATDEYRTAWELERRICQECFDIDIGDIDRQSDELDDFEKMLDEIV